MIINTEVEPAQMKYGPCRPSTFPLYQMHVQPITPEQTHSLRHRVLWPHIEKEEQCTIDIDNRADAIHLGTFDGQRIVSIGSLFAMDSPKIHFSKQYRLRAMATDPEYRGKDAGRLLVQHAMHLLREKGCDVLWCDARIGAVGFYSRLGFQKLEEIYDVPRIGPHQFMWVEL